MFALVFLLSKAAVDSNGEGGDVRQDAPVLKPFEIAKGVTMPALNLGHTDDGSSDGSSVELWISLGGRGIDTAFDYFNQAFGYLPRAMRR